MPAPVRLKDIEQDSPIELLKRRRVFGDKMLWAFVNLEQGCRVEQHRHESEQIAFLISGRARWCLGEAGTADYREVDGEAGTVLHIPSNYWHGIEALEETAILDVLSPSGEMGVDSQGR